MFVVLAVALIAFSLLPYGSARSGCEERRKQVCEIEGRKEDLVPPCGDLRNGPWLVTWLAAVRTTED